MDTHLQGPIVVGTDGSPSATAALLDATRTAAARDLPLHIVSAYRRAPAAVQRRERSRLPATLDVDYAGSGYAVAHNALEDAEDIADRLGVAYSCHAIRGDVAESLLAVSAEVDGALLVVGNRGVDSPFRRFRPPVCDVVGRHARCAVQVVDTRRHWAPAPAQHRDTPWI